MVNLPGNLAPGTWYIGALADYHSQIGESNEANNNGNYLTITVPAQSLAENDAASNDTWPKGACWRKRPGKADTGGSPAFDPFRSTDCASALTAASEGPAVCFRR